MLEDDPRVALAAERTLLAWIRTGLAMMGFGFVVARFGLFLRELEAVGHMTVRRGNGYSLWIGTALVVLGVLVCVAATFDHVRFMHQLAQGKRLGNAVSRLGIAMAVLLAVLGAGMALYLLTMPH